MSDIGTCRQDGLRFYQGSPCKHGHSGIRYTRNKACRECQQALGKASKARHHEREKVRKREWKRANRERYLVSKANERERYTARVPDALLYSHDKYELQDGRCAYCGQDGELKRAHMVPLSRGGKHEWINIIYLCPRHNASKAGATDEEYRAANNIPSVTPWDSPI